MTEDEFMKLLNSLETEASNIPNIASFGFLIVDAQKRITQTKDAILAAFSEKTDLLNFNAELNAKLVMQLAEKNDEIAAANESALKFMQAWQAAEAKIDALVVKP